MSRPSRGSPTRFRSGISHVLHPAHLRRTLTIALVVGTFLTLANQGEVILAGHVSAGIALKVTTNYLTPLVVSNLGLLGGRRPEGDPGSAS